MRRVSILAFLLLTIITQAQQKFIINGELTNPEDNSTIILTKSFKDTIGESIIKDSRFFLEGKLDKESERFFLLITKNGVATGRREIWLSPGETTIKGNANAQINLWNVQNVSSEQQDLNMYMSARRNDMAERNLLKGKLDSLSLIWKDKEISEKNKQGLKQEMDFIQTRIKAVDSCILKTEFKLLEDSKAITDPWIEMLYHQSAGLIGNKDTEFVNKIYTFYNKMNDTQKNSLTGNLLTENIKRYELIGKPVLNVEFKDLEGNIHFLSEYKGKYLLIDFWASWCGPCIMAFPQLKNLKETFGDQLNVVSVNLDGDYEKWKNASIKHKLEWGNLSENKPKGGDGFHKTYLVSSIPSYMLISPEGILLDLWMGYHPDPSVMINRIKRSIN